MSFRPTALAGRMNVTDDTKTKTDGPYVKAANICRSSRPICRLYITQQSGVADIARVYIKYTVYRLQSSDGFRDVIVS